MSDRRPQHPSGRPVHKPKWGVKSVWRIPDDGPVIPRLREQDGALAIGFTARISADDGDE